MGFFICLTILKSWGFSLTGTDSWFYFSSALAFKVVFGFFLGLKKLGFNFSLTVDICVHPLQLGCKPCFVRENCEILFFSGITRKSGFEGWALAILLSFLDFLYG